jgi:hypothetical protein
MFRPLVRIQKHQPYDRENSWRILCSLMRKWEVISKRPDVHFVISKVKNVTEFEGLPCIIRMISLKTAKWVQIFGKMLNKECICELLTCILWVLLLDKIRLRNENILQTFWCNLLTSAAIWMTTCSGFMSELYASVDGATKAWSSVAPRRQTLLSWRERERERERGREGERETAPSFPVSGARWNIYEALCQGAALVGATVLQHGALPVSRS